MGQTKFRSNADYLHPFLRLFRTYVVPTGTRENVCASVWCLLFVILLWRKSFELSLILNAHALMLFT